MSPEEIQLELEHIHPSFKSLDQIEAIVHYLVHEAAKQNYDFVSSKKKHLVVSFYPYIALKRLAHLRMYINNGRMADDIVQYPSQVGMLDIVRLERHDKIIIEVG